MKLHSFSHTFFQKLHLFTLLIGVGLNPSCKIRQSTTEPASAIKITNGVQESGFPEVVMYSIFTSTGKGRCTGTFIRPDLILTAAHCVESALTIQYDNTVVDRSGIMIHTKWPAPENGCQIQKNIRYDLALIRFPTPVYFGDVARFTTRLPMVDETLKIVGWGNNVIENFEAYCSIPAMKDDQNQQCNVMRGVRNTTTGLYDYVSIKTFAPSQSAQTSSECPLECSKEQLGLDLAMEGLTFQTFIDEKCSGNFRDRHYRESGSGVKRSGENTVVAVSDGLIQFYGELGGVDSGIGSSSGAGDSGGPLYIKIPGYWGLVGVTHGGDVIPDGHGGYVKKTFYVALNDPENWTWLLNAIRSIPANP